MDPRAVVDAVARGRTLMGWLHDNVADKPWCPAWVANILIRGREWGAWRIKESFNDWMAR